MSFQKIGLHISVKSDLESPRRANGQSIKVLDDNETMIQVQENYKTESKNSNKKFLLPQNNA